MSIANLPDELLLHILSQLHYRDLASARRTCRHWSNLSRDAVLIDNLARRDYRVEDWCNGEYYPTPDEIGLAVFLFTSRESYSEYIRHKMILDYGRYQTTVITQKALDIARKLKKNHLPPSQAMVTSLATFLHHNYLQPPAVSRLWLRNINLSEVPHASCLVGVRRQSVRLDNVTGDLAPVLELTRCGVLSVSSMVLGAGDTRALVTALAAGVDKLSLGYDGEVELDMASLVTHDGQGRCCTVQCSDNTWARYG